MNRSKRLSMIASVVGLAAAASASGDASLAAHAKPLCRQSLAAPEYRQAIRADGALLRRLNDGLRAPGLSLTVATGGKIVWSVSCGYADLKSHRPVTAHTRFRIGSVSKTLTATALVFSLFLIRPTPFCLLDEVDAPLDDANVGRFVTKIAEMSEKTQFLVITHNKRTMEAAKALYGVTMQEAGVSKVVSVRFE